MKKLTALLVSLAMVFTMLPMAAIAEGDEDAAVPEDAEEISAGSFGFDGPEIFDESLTNPGVELGGDEEQDETEDETTPETDEEAPSEAETEEPAEEPTETTEPTEAETEPEVEPDNGVSDEEVEAFKEYVYSLGERELEEANVIELFLALGIISEDSEMTNAEYYQYVLDNGFDNMADLVDAAIVWKVLYLRENEPDWPFEPVQSDPGIIEGPGYESMPNTTTVSAAEIDALFQLMARPRNKRLNVELVGVEDGDNVYLEASTVSGLFESEWSTQSSDYIYNSYDPSALEETNPSDSLTIDLKGDDSKKYQINAVRYSGEKMPATIQDQKITITGDTLGDDLYYALGASTITIEVGKIPPKTVKVTIEETKNSITDSARYTIEGLQKTDSNPNGTTRDGTAASLNSGSGVTANDGDHITLTISSGASLISSISISGPGEGETSTLPAGVTSMGYDIKAEQKDDPTVTIRVTYKNKASLADSNGVKVTIDKDSEKTFSDGISSVTVSGTSSLPSSNGQSDSVSETANSEQELKDAIAKFLVGDTINLEVTPKTPEGGGTYRLTTFSGGSGGSVVPETGTVSNVSLGTSMTFTFTFTTVKDAPTLTVTASTGNLSSGTVTFTVKDYENYKMDITTANVDANCDTHSSGSTAVSKNEDVTIGGDGTFGVTFSPKNHKAFNFSYGYTVTGKIEYDNKPITKSTTISLGKAA